MKKQIKAIRYVLDPRTNSRLETLLAFILILAIIGCFYLEQLGYGAVNKELTTTMGIVIGWLFGRNENKADEFYSNTTPTKLGGK